VNQGRVKYPPPAPNQLHTKTETVTLTSTVTETDEDIQDQDQDQDRDQGQVQNQPQTPMAPPIPIPVPRLTLWIRLSAVAIKLATTNVSLATAVGLSLTFFVAGIVVRDYWKEKSHDTFDSGYHARESEDYAKHNTYADGYHARDTEAYSQFVNRPQVHWTVVGVHKATHYSGRAYDIKITGGNVVKNFIPCESAGWYVGMVIIGAGYYNHGKCMSFLGPNAYLDIDTDPKILETKGISR